VLGIVTFALTIVVLSVGAHGCASLSTHAPAPAGRTAVRPYTIDAVTVSGRARAARPYV
jgi:hypothetical protein